MCRVNYSVKPIIHVHKSLFFYQSECEEFLITVYVFQPFNILDVLGRHLKLLKRTGRTRGKKED